MLILVHMLHHHSEIASYMYNNKFALVIYVLFDDEFYEFYTMVCINVFLICMNIVVL